MSSPVAGGLYAVSPKFWPHRPPLLEWRLLGPALRTMAASKREVVAVGPPRHPCMAGLRHLGIDTASSGFAPEQPAERLWAAEQLIRSGSTCTVLAWLSQVRAEQIRLLQVCAQGSGARPEAHAWIEMP